MLLTELKGSLKIALHFFSSVHTFRFALIASLFIFCFFSSAVFFFPLAHICGQRCVNRLGMSEHTTTVSMKQHCFCYRNDSCTTRVGCAGAFCRLCAFSFPVFLVFLFFVCFLFAFAIAIRSSALSSALYAVNSIWHPGRRMFVRCSVKWIKRTTRLSSCDIWCFTIRQTYIHSHMPTLTQYPMLIDWNV